VENALAAQEDVHRRVLPTLSGGNSAEIAVELKRFRTACKATRKAVEAAGNTAAYVVATVAAADKARMAYQRAAGPGNSKSIDLAVRDAARFAACAEKECRKAGKTAEELKKAWLLVQIRANGKASRAPTKQGN
jgi:hypothetical protein